MALYHNLFTLMENDDYDILKTDYSKLNSLTDNIQLLNNIPCKVNLIPYNEIGASYSRPDNYTINNFERILSEAPFTTTIRWSKGINIDAGCGQLAVSN